VSTPNLFLAMREICQEQKNIKVKVVSPFNYQYDNNFITVEAYGKRVGYLERNDIFIPAWYIPKDHRERVAKLVMKDIRGKVNDWKCRNSQLLEELLGNE
jgi:hypothetical protein